MNVGKRNLLRHACFWLSFLIALLWFLPFHHADELPVNITIYEEGDVFEYGKWYITNVAGSVKILNPSGNPMLFDNSTLNVTGGSSITLQWYMNVYVEDPDGNFIPNAPVWVEDRNDDLS